MRTEDHSEQLNNDIRITFTSHSTPAQM